MLVLSRKTGERILIGENIAVTIVRISQGTVRIGIEAPRETSVVREEVALQDAQLPQEGIEISLSDAAALNHSAPSL